MAGPTRAPDPVRVARPEEYPLLTEIELAADQLFAAHGVRVPDGGTPMAVLAAAAEVLVTGDPPVGSARLEEVDGLAHLEQLSVHPAAMRAGPRQRAAARQRRLGSRARIPGDHPDQFRTCRSTGPSTPVTGSPRSPSPAGLAAIREHERGSGLYDRDGVRVAMRRDVPEVTRPG